MDVFLPYFQNEPLTLNDNEKTYSDNTTHSNGSIPLTVNFSLTAADNEQFYNSVRKMRAAESSATAYCVVIMPPAFSDTGNNFNIAVQLVTGQIGDSTGICFDSTGFTLPNGATHAGCVLGSNWSAGMFNRGTKSVICTHLSRLRD